jgi:hypothetical protein
MGWLSGQPHSTRMAASFGVGWGVGAGRVVGQPHSTRMASPSGWVEVWVRAGVWVSPTRRAWLPPSADARESGCDHMPGSSPFNAHGCLLRRVCWRVLCVTRSAPLDAHGRSLPDPSGVGTCRSAPLDAHAYLLPMSCMYIRLWADRGISAPFDAHDCSLQCRSGCWYGLVCLAQPHSTRTADSFLVAGDGMQGTGSHHTCAERHRGERALTGSFALCDDVTSIPYRPQEAENDGSIMAGGVHACTPPA